MNDIEYPLIDTYTTELHGQTVEVKVYAPQVSPDLGMVGSTQSQASKLAEAQPRGPLAYDFKALSFCGRTQSLKMWAEEYRLNFNTLARRLRSGWSLEDALLVPTISRGSIRGSEV